MSLILNLKERKFIIKVLKDFKSSTSQAHRLKLQKEVNDTLTISIVRLLTKLEDYEAESCLLNIKKNGLLILKKPRIVLPISDEVYDAIMHRLTYTKSRAYAN